MALGTQRVDTCLSFFSELYSYRTSSVGKLRKTVLCIVGEVRPSRRYNAHLPDPPAISSQTGLISEMPLPLPQWAVPKRSFCFRLPQRWARLGTCGWTLSSQGCGSWSNFSIAGQLVSQMGAPWCQGAFVPGLRAGRGPIVLPPTPRGPIVLAPSGCCSPPISTGRHPAGSRLCHHSWLRCLRPWTP